MMCTFQAARKNDTTTIKQSTSNIINLIWVARPRHQETTAWRQHNKQQTAVFSFSFIWTSHPKQQETATQQLDVSPQTKVLHVKGSLKYVYRYTIFPYIVYVQFRISEWFCYLWSCKIASHANRSIWKVRLPSLHVRSVLYVSWFRTALTIGP